MNKKKIISVFMSSLFLISAASDEQFLQTAYGETENEELYDIKDDNKEISEVPEEINEDLTEVVTQKDDSEESDIEEEVYTDSAQEYGYNYEDIHYSSQEIEGGFEIPGYTSGDNYYTEPGGQIDIDKPLIISINPTWFSFIGNVDVYAKSKTDGKRTNLGGKVIGHPDDDEGMKVVIESSDLKRLKDTEYTLEISFSYTSRSGNYIKYYDYLDISLKDNDPTVVTYVDGNEEKLPEDNSIFNVENGELISLNLTDEQKSKISTCKICNEVDGQEISKIGKNAFKGCNNLKEIKIKGKVKSISEDAFALCTSLESVELGMSLRNIGNAAFRGCNNLKEIVIPNSVTCINDALFSGCENLKKVTLPSSVTTISPYSFLNCINLEEINIPEKVTEIGDLAFVNCFKLKNIELPDTITRIGESAFENCVSVENIKIPCSCTEFDKTTFRNDNKVMNIEVRGEDDSQKDYISEKIKRSIKGEDIGDYVPSGKKQIAYYTSKASEDKILDDSIFKVENGVLTGLKISDYDKAELYFIEIPEYINGTRITKIGDSLFKGCTSLATLNISKSIEVINNAAFIGCTSLEHMEIPDSVKEIGDACFAGCSNLDRVYLPSSLTKLSPYLFNGCIHLRYVSIPETIKSIGTLTFGNCWNLDEIKIPSEVDSIEDYAFYGCVDFIEVNCPDSINYMGEGVFAECKNLKTVKLPKYVTDISAKLFMNCTSLETIKLPYMITSIGDEAFYGCDNISNMITQEE